MAESVFVSLVSAAGLDAEFEVESAGVGPWHVGEAPDPRASQTARAHGIALHSVAQQMQARDFGRLDHVIALDGEVATALRRLAPSPADQAKVQLLREFDPLTPGTPDLDVPDPYYAGPDGFEIAYQMIERSARHLLETLRALKTLPPGAAV